MVTLRVLMLTFPLKIIWKIVGLFFQRINTPVDPLLQKVCFTRGGKRFINCPSINFQLCHQEMSITWVSMVLDPPPIPLLSPDLRVLSR